VTRSLYQGLVWLHPPAFRAEFGGEMQWIFDQISGGASGGGAGGGVTALFADAVVSLLRQWIVRYGTWKIAAGFVGGIIHMWLVFACLMLRPPLPRIPEPAEEPCGTAVLGCVALGQKHGIPCSNCEMSPNSIPESQR
jgi:hypothetical protein